ELCDYGERSPVLAESYEQEPSGTIIYSIPVEGEVGADIELSLSVEDGHDDKFYLDIKNITWAVVYDMEEENWLLVNLGISDVNEFPPELKDAPYKVNISEFTLTGTTVLVFDATDEDCDSNVQFYYDIEKGPGSNHFVIPSKGTPEVILVEEVDYEENTWFNITISVADDDDENALNSTGQMHVTVEDADDMRPIFGDVTYNAAVTENDVNVQLLPDFLINAYDQDYGIDEDVYYSFADPERVNDTIYETDYFRIDENTGEVVLINELDREALPDGTVTVVLRAAQVNSMGYHIYTYRDGYATLVVTVLDVNDNAPNMSSPIYYGEVAEHSLQDTIVCEVSATDIDEDENALFEFVIESDLGNGDTFYIDDPISITPKTAISFIRINDSTYLDAENIAGQINITVYAIETQTTEKYRSKHSTVSITVLDINDNSPQFIGEPYSASVSEDITEETSLIAAVDADSDDLTFTFEDGLSETTDGLFKILSSTGEIVLIDLLDRENKTYHNLTLCVSDENPNNNDTTFLLVTVTDINDNNPVITAFDSSVTILEEEAGGVVITYVTATDEDEGENAQWNYTIVDRLANDFTVDDTTGEVTTLKAFDREEQDTYEVYILAVDHGESPRSGQTYVTVSLIDINDNPPVFESDSYEAAIPEQTLGIFVVTVKANDIDADENAVVSYAVVSENGTDYEYFDVDETTGNVYITSFVTIEDVGETLTVKIEAYNEIPYASDDIVNGTTNITVTLLCDAQQFSLTIGCQPNPSNEFTLTIDIFDLNDVAPVFDKDIYSTNVNEMTPVDTLVFDDFSAADGDCKKTTLLYFIEEGPGSNHFTIPATAITEIFLAKPLDYELDRFYNLTLIVYDDYTSQNDTRDYHIYTYRDGYATLVVTVLDVNDNAPIMSSPIYYGEVAEHSLQDTIVCEVSATDIDEGENAVFQFVVESAFADGNTIYVDDPISITPNIAISFIRVNDPAYLDAENISGTLDIKVYAIETDTPEKRRSEYSTVSITVLDINDNSPQFTGEAYSVSVSEDITEETFLITVEAMDDDQDANNYAIEYSIWGVTDSGMEILESTTTLGN
ncbi:cadherin-23-like, partial [Saccoglossus kowalevskii]